MAILLGKELSNGISINYWKISTVTIDYVGNETIVHLSVYKDKQARVDGKDPVMYQQINIKDIIENRVSLYLYISSLPEFVGMENDI